MNILKTSKYIKSAMSGTGIVRLELRFFVFFTKNECFVTFSKFKFCLLFYEC